MGFQHVELAGGRWYTLTLAEQMGNIGSEVNRARIAEGKHDDRFINARNRALELFDLTLMDPRWRHGRIREIGRAREVFCDAVFGGKEYGSTLDGIQKYFDQFALAARR